MKLNKPRFLTVVQIFTAICLTLKPFWSSSNY